MEGLPSNLCNIGWGRGSGGEEEGLISIILLLCIIKESKQYL